MERITNLRANTIGRLSRLTGVNVETIRYYERIGLLAAPARTGGGHRTYDEQARRQLGFIKSCRDLGFSLEEIRALLALLADNNVTCDEVRVLTEKHLATVRDKRAELQRMEAVLEAMVAECRNGQMPQCPIVDALFARNEQEQV
jgi:MerR family mercuric resistance operon transcriptional regulator